MVKADPQLAWIKDAEKRGDVDWRQVKEIHDSFKYSNSGLGPASQIIIAIVMAAVVGPLAAGAMGTATGGMVVAGTMTANTATFISAASGAVAAGAATNATVSVINNRGNLGAVFKDVTSSDAMKGYVISGVTAGLTAAYFDGWTGTKTEYGTGNITSPPLNTWTGVGQFAASQTLQNGTSMLVGKALGQGGSGSDALKSALFNTRAAVSFNAVGDYTKGRLTEGYPPKIIVHAMVGGLLAEATGGDFKTGALAAGVNEAVVGHLSSLVHGDKTLLSMSSQVIGVLAAATQKDADAESLEKGGWVAKNATQYNHSLHEMQTVALDGLRRRDPENKAKYDAAACALTHCSASVPQSDKNYKALVELENKGNEFTEEIALLKSTGQFDYTFKDRIDDALSANNELFSNVGYAAVAAGEAGAGAVSYFGMVGTSPACVSIVGCAAPFALGAVGTAAFAGAASTYDQIGAPYTSTEGERVLASFHPEQYPGEASPLGDLSQRAAESLAELAVAHYAGKALSGELSSVIKNGVNPNAATKGQPVFGGGTDNEAGTLVERNVIEGTSKGAKATGDAAGKVDDLASTKVKWVDENAGMSSRARDYNGSATGARSNPATQFGQAPALERTMPDGSTRLVKFDGVDGEVLVDRKISVVTTSKSKDQALRQSDVLSQNGLTARWEVPTQAQANRAQKMFDELGIKNISVKVIREPGNQ